jgi:two-component system sensor histidine kinase and response regulator WspE
VSGKSAPDPALLDLFRAEIDTHLPALSEGLLALEKDPNQPKRLEALMRAAHSIKGAARIVGVEAAVQVAHAMEDCFVAAQKGAVTLTSDAVDVLLRGVDALHRIAPASGEPAEGGSAEEKLPQLLDDIAALRAGRPPAAAPTAVVETGPPTVRAGGDLEGAEAEAFRGRLAEALARGGPVVRLDFAAVGAVGPDGLAVLARAARAAAGRRPPVAFEAVNAAPSVRTLLHLTRLDRAFPAGVEGR